MSILIRGMDMPKDCAECDIHNPLADTPYCRRLMQKIPREGRLKNCPLVEVTTPHGRLIDADAFAKTLKDISIRQGYDKLTFDKSLTVDDVLDSVIVELNASGLDGSKNAPTVIEAEE